MIQMLLTVTAAAALSAAEPLPANSWVPVGDGAFELPKSGYPDLFSANLLWIESLSSALVAPTFAKQETAYRLLPLDDPRWTFKPGSAPKNRVPDRWQSPKSCVYLPGLERVLFLKQQWYYSRDKRPASGWLLDPATGEWTPLNAALSMSDRSKDFTPAGGRDGMRLPLWGAMVYDAHNREAVSFGGGGVWGRVGKAQEKVEIGDWIFEEAKKNVRRLVPGDDDVTEARRWFPAHCGTWTFSEATRTWSAIDQPLGQQPSGRILPGMAFDAAAKKIVLFGGDDLSRCLGDTWVYDCTTRTWSRAEPEVSPPARAGHAMVYVPEQDVVLLAGGYAGGWRALKDVWVYRTADATWTRLDLDLPVPAAHASADYVPDRRAILLAAFKGTRRNKSLPVYSLRLDLASAPNGKPVEADPKKDYHCKAWRSWGSPLPDEWLAGKNAPGDPAAGIRELAALPANTWVARKPPANVPMRGWGSYIYDVRTHTGFAWGGGHSTYPGAEISQYDLLTNRWQSMNDPVNYNPVWLHGMVGGPPGVSFGGWSLLPSHARKSYGVDPVSNSVVTYGGDVYSIEHRRFVTHVGPFPIGWGGPSYQVAYVTTPHGLCGYATTYSSASLGHLARVNVAAGKWDLVAKGGPKKHNEYGHLAYDSKRDRLVYFYSDARVWTFDFKSTVWAEEESVGPKPAKALGDSTYVPDLDAVLMIFADSRGAKERLVFYNLGERKWYTAPYIGAPAWRGNSSGRDYSPIYDPELKVVVRLSPGGSKWMAVHLMRLVPEELKLTPVQ